MKPPRVINLDQIGMKDIKLVGGKCASLGEIKWRLSTADAHQFYMKFGFSSLKEPMKIMEKICTQ
jgi:hypothetical protein